MNDKFFWEELNVKICIFFHRFDGGGAERTTVILANELYRRGHNITIAVRYNKGPLKALLNPEIPVIDMKLPENGKLTKNLKNILCLIQLMNGKQYDLIVAAMSEMAQVAAAAHALSSKVTPLICVLHNTMSVERTSFQTARHFFFNFFDRHYSRVIAVSEAVRIDYLSCCRTNPGKAVTIYNPVIDDRIFKLSRQRPLHPWLEQDRTYTTLLMVGRLTQQKNHSLMFHALKLLRDTGDFRLILLGEGEQQPVLVREAEELGLAPWIDFAGFSDNPYGYMASCDCLVLSSRYEGLPTVLIEAMACGCRIVSTDCPSGPREILLEDKYGVLVEMDNPRALKAGILRALEQKLDREALRKRSMDFSVEKAAKEYEKIFTETVAISTD